MSGLPSGSSARPPTLRYNFGVNTVFLTSTTRRASRSPAEPLASAVIIRGNAPSDPLPGLKVLTNDDVIADLQRPTKSGKSTIDIIQVLLWFVAGGIIALIVYLTALERVRDFAVLKATGSSNRTLFGALLFQAVVLSIGAAALAIGIALLLEPLFPFQIVLSSSDVPAARSRRDRGRSRGEPRRPPSRDRRRPCARLRERVMPDLHVRDLTMEFSSGGYKVRPIDSFDLDVK